MTFCHTDQAPMTFSSHPFKSGTILHSPGAHFSYRIIGPCCRLFDREQLPWPCCRLQWRGKEPSWRRIGRRLIADLSTRNSPSYSVEVLGQGSSEALVITLYWVRLPPDLRDWWHSDRTRHGVELLDLNQPRTGIGEDPSHSPVSHNHTLLLPGQQGNATNNQPQAH